MRILRYRGNSYASPEPINSAPRPSARSYRWVKYAIETNKVVPLAATRGRIKQRSTGGLSQLSCARAGKRPWKRALR